MNRPLTPRENTRLAELFSENIETALDQCVGQCHLRHPTVAELVFNAIQHFHPARYQLFTWCIMPNHVHALFRPIAPHTLETILHSWKSFTSNEANRILQRQGIFWMPEYFDHLIRDQQDFKHAHEYILNNPKKANLKNWPWAATFIK